LVFALFQSPRFSLGDGFVCVFVFIGFSRCGYSAGTEGVAVWCV
jgi:hypothetical protein